MMYKTNVPVKTYKALLSENEEAVLLAGYLLMLQRMGKIPVYSHIPHETYTTSWTAKRRNTRAGVRRGVPDYIVPTAHKLLFIELKRTKGGTVSPDQEQWIEALNQIPNVEARVCRGYEAAKAFIEENI